MRKNAVKNDTQSPWQVAGWRAGEGVAEILGYKLQIRGKLLSHGMRVPEVIAGTLLSPSHTAHFALHMASLVLPTILRTLPGLSFCLPSTCQGLLVYIQPTVPPVAAPELSLASLSCRSGSELPGRSRGSSEALRPCSSGPLPRPCRETGTAWDHNESVR